MNDDAPLVGEMSRGESESVGQAASPSGATATAPALSSGSVDTRTSLTILVLLLVDSLHFIFARALIPYLPGVTSAFYVLLIATAETGIYLGVRRLIRMEVLRQHLRFFLVIGFLVAASTVLNYSAVAYVDAGTAAMLSRTVTLFSLGLGIFWLRERLGPLELLGATIAAAGTFVISFQPGELLLLGSLMILGSAFLYALHAAVVKQQGGSMDFANFFFFRVASTAGFLLLFAAGQGALVWPGVRAWLILLLAASVDVVFSRILYYQALRRLAMSHHAIILTLSPVVTIFWSLALFGSWPTLQGLLGGSAVIAGVLVVTLRRRRRAVA